MMGGLFGQVGETAAPPEPRQNIVTFPARNSQIIDPARKFYDVPKISTRSVDNLVEKIEPTRGESGRS